MATDKFLLFPVCRECRQGSLLLMPRKNDAEPLSVYCMYCQHHESLENVLWAVR